MERAHPQPDNGRWLAPVLAAIREASGSEDLAVSARLLLRELVSTVGADGGIVLLPGDAVGGEPFALHVSTDPLLTGPHLRAAAEERLRAGTECVPCGQAGTEGPFRCVWTLVRCRPGTCGVLGLFCVEDPHRECEAPRSCEVCPTLALLIADQLAATVNHACARLALAAERKALDRASYHLFALRHAARVLGGSVDLPELIAKCMDMLMELFPVETARLVLHEKASPRFAALREGHAAHGNGGHLHFVSVDSAAAEWFRSHPDPLTREQVLPIGEPTPSGDQPAMRGTRLPAPVAALLADPQMPPAEAWAPLVTDELFLGYVAMGKSRTDDALSPDNLELLSTLVRQAATAIETTEKNYARELLRRYTSPEVVEELLSKPGGLSVKRQVVTVLFADIRGFTTYSEQHEPSVVVAHLNEYFAEMGEIILGFRGTLAAYIGDGLMALFGAPIARADDAHRAVCAARKMQARMVTLRDEWDAEGRHPFRIGIGVHTGEVVVGTIGFEDKMEYTAIGDTVNVAARLEQLTKSHPATILASDTTLQAAGAIESGRLLGSVDIRGKSQPITAYAVDP